MKDNFSAQAAAYASYRPHYPQEMMQYIVSLTHNRYAALDLATGNGQVAVAPAPYFEKVYATDISAKQLENAKKVHNIYYSVGSAEQTEFQSHSFDLVTVAQAIPFPLQETEAKQFYNHFTWTFEQLTGYLNTWSAVQHYIKERGENPVDILKNDLQSVWEASDKQVTFPLLLRLGTFAK